MVTTEAVCMILSLVLGVTGFWLGLYAIIEVKAMQRSTHKIEYVPLDPHEAMNAPKGALVSDDEPISKLTEAQKKILTDDEYESLS